MKKRGVILLCMLALSVSLTACGGKDNNNSSSESSTAQESGTQESGAGQTASGESGSSGGEENGATGGAAENGSGGNGAGAGNEGNTAGGAGNESAGWSAEMEEVKSALVETLGDNYWPNSKITPEMLEGTFGLAPEMYDDYFGEMPMISTNVDTILVVKAKEGQADDVETALNTYREALVNDTMQYPMNLGKIQASRIEVIGSYVCFVQLGADVTEAMEKGDEEVIAYCQEQNELAIEVLNKALAK